VNFKLRTWVKILPFIFRTALICIAVPGEKYWTGNEVNMGNCNNSLLNTNSPPVFKRPIEQLTSDEDDDHFVPLSKSYPFNFLLFQLGCF
jgi:hypothetical protein